MAKKTVRKRSPGRSAEDGTHVTGPDVEKQDADPSPEVQAAASTVHRAETELRKAREAYERVRREAAEQLRQVRQTTLGDLIDGTLKAASKHPGKGLAIAAVIGFLLARLFRR